MTIGLPRALLYHRYGVLWKMFFETLGFAVAVSRPTDAEIMEKGIHHCIGECCLPVKVFLGHVADLDGRCDMVFVPRYERFCAREEYCVRFWGLPDIVHGTFPAMPLLTCNIAGKKNDDGIRGFLEAAAALHAEPWRAVRAYRRAAGMQRESDRLASQEQDLALENASLKVLVAAQPYIIGDDFIGGPLLRLISEQGATPIMTNRLDRAACRSRSREISKDLYWTMNQEIIGAIPHLRERADGVLLVSAFPCGTDSLVNELVLRRVREIPIAHIILDEQQGTEGLGTRIESFIDILRERGRGRVVS